MGGHAYWYVVPHEGDVQTALNKLRAREFKAGRYNPAVMFPDFPVNAASLSPGAQHRSIEEALLASDADGTRSILDIDHISKQPEFCSAAPLPEQVLLDLYGTRTPSRSAVEENMDFLADIERGHAVYIELFENGRAAEILFAGYSFD
jgi:hypothetical protein